MARVAATPSVPDEVLAADLTDAHLNELDSRYRHRLWGFFRRRGFSEFEADDLTQEVLIVLVTGGAAAFDPSRVGRDGRPTRFSAWLFAIAYRKMADALDKADRACPFSDLSVSHPDDGDEDDPADWADPRAECSAVAAHALLREALGICRGELNDRESLVIDLWLASVGTLKLKELATVLGVRGTTVPHRVRDRAFHKLQDCLSGKGFNAYGATCEPEGAAGGRRS